VAAAPGQLPAAILLAALQRRSGQAGRRGAFGPPAGIAGLTRAVVIFGLAGLLA